MDAMQYKGFENEDDLIEWIGDSTLQVSTYETTQTLQISTYETIQTLQVATYETTQTLVLRVVDRRDDDPKVENARMLFLDSEIGDALLFPGQYLLRNAQPGKDGYVTAYYYVVNRDELRLISAASTEPIFIID